jgi:hypothetical protein
MLKTLAPDYPAPLIFRVADHEGLAAIRLGFRLSALSFFFFELTAVLRLIFVVNTVKVLVDDLTVFRFRRSFDVKVQFCSRTNTASLDSVSSRSWG